MRVDDATEQRAVGGWRAERAVGGWRAERRVAAGQERGEQQSWRLDRERRTERLAWIHGGAVNTRHRSREARQHGIGSSESESR